MAAARQRDVDVMTTRGCACGCDANPVDAQGNPYVPPVKAGTGHASGIAIPVRKMLGLSRIGGILGPGDLRWTDGVRDTGYRYLTTVWNSSFFVPTSPYSSRAVSVLGPGGWFNHSGSNFQTGVNTFFEVHDDTVPADYSQLASSGGWQPSEHIEDAPFYGAAQYLRYTRQIRYFTFGNLADDTRKYIAMFDIYEKV